MRQHSQFSDRTERAVIAVICLDLVLQTAETVDALAGAATFFFIAGVAVWLLYTIEWCVRIRRAEDWKKYAFSFMGVVDFLAVLPLCTFTGFDLKALRAFRLFRLFVLTAKLATRTSAVVKLARAFRFAMDEAGALFAETCIGVIGAACGIMADALREANVGEGVDRFTPPSRSETATRSSDSRSIPAPASTSASPEPA